MTLVEMIEAFDALGKQIESHALDCRCTSCDLFMELADSITQRPMAEISAATRKLAEKTVGRRQTAVGRSYITSGTPVSLTRV